MTSLSSLSPAQVAALDRLGDEASECLARRGETDALNELVALLLAEVRIDGWGRFWYRLSAQGRLVKEMGTA